MLLCPTVSRINHSCAPNVVFQVRDGDSLDGNPGADNGSAEHVRVRVQALRDIAVDEEICACYLHGFKGVQERRAALAEGWGFDCLCSRCTDMLGCGYITGAKECAKTTTMQEVQERFQACAASEQRRERIRELLRNSGSSSGGTTSGEKQNQNSSQLRQFERAKTLLELATEEGPPFDAPDFMARHAYDAMQLGMVLAAQSKSTSGDITMDSTITMTDVAHFAEIAYENYRIQEGEEHPSTVMARQTLDTCGFSAPKPTAESGADESATSDGPTSIAEAIEDAAAKEKQQNNLLSVMNFLYSDGDMDDDLFKQFGVDNNVENGPGCAAMNFKSDLAEE